MGIVGSKRSYNPDQDIPDLSGKVIIVTGGNTGVGYHTVKALVKHNAKVSLSQFRVTIRHSSFLILGVSIKVYMASRNESRATGAIAQLKAEGAWTAKAK